MRPRNEPERPRTRGETDSSSADEGGRIERRSRRATTRATGPPRRAVAGRRGTRWLGLFALAIPTAAVAGFGALASARVRALASATRGVRSGESLIAAETPVKTLSDPAVLRVASAPLSEWPAVAVAVSVVVGCWAVAIGGAHLVARLLGGRRLVGR